MKLGKHWVEHIEPSDDPEASSASCCKYRLDTVTGQLMLARALPHDVAFPTNYGFIPHTRCATDDEETDVMVLSTEPLLPLAFDRLQRGFKLAKKRSPK